MHHYDIITILGPTASGKTGFAVRLASLIDAEIISADSRQVYRRMDLGTGKDLEEYEINGKKIPFHLIDIVEPGTKYNLFEYQRDFLEAYNDIRSRGKKVVVCGGPGLYRPLGRGRQLAGELRGCLCAGKGHGLHELCDRDVPVCRAGDHG